jgi:hypothetical protein
MTSNDWSDERLSRIRELIQRLYSTVAELENEFETEQRKFTLDGHLVGSIGEVVAAYAFGLQLLRSSSKDHDARSADGSLVQIKLTGGSKSVSLYSEPVHLIVLQLIDKRFQTVYNGPGSPVWAACGPIQKNGQRTVGLSVLRRLDTSAIPKIQQVRQYPPLT